MKAALPDNETARIAALESYRILDTPAEEAFDDITKLAAFICGTPIATLSLVDRDRQWFKSRLGMPLQQTSRDDAFCAHTILQNDMFIVEDALKDARFSENPMVVKDPHIRFYAGTPITTPEGLALGSFCVIDQKPRILTAEQKDALTRLARMVMTTLELRRVSADLAEALGSIKTLSGLVPICASCKEVRNDKGYWQQVEIYVQNHSDARFTHGLCPKCSEKYFPGIRKEKIRGRP